MEVSDAVELTQLVIVRARIHAGIEHLRGRPIDPEEGRRVQAPREVDAKRPHGSAVAEANADRVHHVVEILEVPLPHAEGDVLHAAVDVPHVMEEYASDVVADERE